MAIAWQRQPPQSISRRPQVWHGSFIQPVPRNVSKAWPLSQISRSGPVADVADRQPLDRLRGVTRQDTSRRRDGQKTASPATHARLRPNGIMVVHDEIEDQDA